MAHPSLKFQDCLLYWNIQEYCISFIKKISRLMETFQCAAEVRLRIQFASYKVAMLLSSKLLAWITFILFSTQLWKKLIDFYWIFSSLDALVCFCLKMCLLKFNHVVMIFWQTFWFIAWKTVLVVWNGKSCFFF